ncbi:hypothetical protein [Embleya sp. NPDC059237]|uniref:hypothetical protein n=1 Tax=Embleya sp. NPDC059237 TaxID=3346784 RepID=UPI0036804763
MNLAGKTRYALGVLGLVLSIGSFAWVIRALAQGGLDAGGQAGVLSFGAGVLGLVFGAPALHMSSQALRLQRDDPTAITRRLATSVRVAERANRQRLVGSSASMIDVNFRLVPEVSQAVFTPTATGPATAATGHLFAIVEYYLPWRPNRLLITGSSGAGKTIAAGDLVLRLLAARAESDPVPVRLTLTGWPEDRDFEGWLVRRLTEVYELPVRDALALVDARLVLPVLDGLDEMDPAASTARPRAIAALGHLNRYIDEHADSGGRPGALILTCRTDAYTDLAARDHRLATAARIVLDDVLVVQGVDYLQRRGVDATRWAPVTATLAAAPGGTLARALSTPWRLNLAVTVYEEHTLAPDGRKIFAREPADLLHLASPGAVRDHLLGLMIPAAVAVRPDHNGRPQYRSGQVHAWLRTLALYLDDNRATGRSVAGRPLPGTDLILHELWPLAGDRRVRAIHALGTCVVGMAMIVGLWIPGTGSTIAGRIIATVVLALIGALGTIHAWFKVWPIPAWFDLEGLRTVERRRRAALGLVVALVLALVVGLELGFLFGLAIGLAVALLGWLRAAVSGSSDDAARFAHPRDLPRANLAVTLALGIGGGVCLGLVGTLVSGLGFGLTVACGYALMVGIAGSRNVVFAAWVHLGTHQLPWRLGRFLNWATEAELLRVAGTAYQFRHRELQEWLTRTPPV